MHAVVPLPGCTREPVLSRSSIPVAYLQREIKRKSTGADLPVSPNTKTVASRMLAGQIPSGQPDLRREALPSDTRVP